MEEILPSRLERAGGRQVVQYRGSVMPLIDLRTVLGGTPDQTADALQVIVYADRGRCVGLVVDQILDVVEQTFTVDRHTARGVVLGSMVLQGQVTDLIDLASVIRTHEPGFFISDVGVAAA